MKRSADLINRSLAVITAVPVTLLCYDRNLLTDNPKGMFSAAVLFAGPLIVLALSNKTWVSVRISFLASYTVSLFVGVRLLSYNGIFARSDPAFPRLSLWTLSLGAGLLASAILLAIEKRKEFNPLAALGGMAAGFVYPVAAFFLSAMLANL